MITTAITFETDNPFSFEAEALIHQVAEAVLQSENCPYDAEIDILLTDNASIREINAEQRGIDAPTDVLSFPAVEYETPGRIPSPEEDPSLYLPEDGSLFLGDMVISVDKVREQAKEYGHSERRELAFLTAHSCFHLLGYDHETEEDMHQMETRQEAVLKSLGITRESV